MLGEESDRLATFGVGLSIGLVAFAAAWASIASAGRSAFVPSAVFLLGALVVGRGRPTFRARLDHSSAAAALAVAAFLVAMGFVYAMTLAPSPRDGFQPIEFFDTGYYSVLGADLAETGLESIYPPSGFDQIPGLPEQTWYHWGELWLAAAIIDLTHISPMHARHLVVLPILLLAIASTAGGAVRNVVARQSAEYVLLAAAAALFLAPIPLLRDPEIEWFARGLVVSITQYGLAAVVITLAIHAIVGRTSATRADRILAAALGAALVASHIGLAAMILGAALMLLLAHALRRVYRHGRHRLSWRGLLMPMPRLWMALMGGASTLVWGLATGHGLGGLAPILDIAPFDPAWARAMLETAVGAGVLIAVPIAWFATGSRIEPVYRLLRSAVLAVALGALSWGVMVSDLNTFHLFFGTIVTVLTPALAIASVALLHRARKSGRNLLASVVLAAVLGQTVLSALFAGLQLRSFGPLAYPPTPVPALAALRSLGPDAKAAYSCSAIENFAPWDASLVSLDAHTSVRMIPMCFIADRARRILGRSLDPTIESPYFRNAPQRHLYTSADANPSADEITSFLRANGVAYIYSDAAHPNLLLPGATPIFVEGGVTIFRIP